MYIYIHTMCMYIYIHIYVFPCIYIYIHIYTQILTYIHTNINTYTRIYTHTHTSQDNPLSEIDEPNVFPGPSEFGPDSPTALGPLGNALNSACCGGSGENAFGAPALSVAEMRKVYELGEPNFKKWKEFEKENNIFPGIVDWDPDSPKGYNPPFETKELFDGHGGIIGLEDSDGWEVTPESAAYRDYSKYADGSTEGMDHNVYANGYVFPDY